MKKLFAVLLTLTLLVSLTVPIFAAEEVANSWICPACGGTCYDSPETGSYSKEVTAYSCSWEDGTHTHLEHYRIKYAYCEDCGYRLSVAHVYEYTTCRGRYV